MFPSRTISVTLNRPYDEVYAFMSNPANLSRWTGGVLHAPLEQVEGNLWRTVYEDNSVDLEFTPINPFGIIDLQVRGRGMADRRYWARLFPNGEGTELCCTILQHADEPDAKFQSDFEWLRSDLMILKTFIDML